MNAVTQVGDPQRDGEVWLVPSASGGAVYTVYESFPGSGGLRCDCPDYWYRKRLARGRGQCKHVGAVLAQMEDDCVAGAQR